MIICVHNVSCDRNVDTMCVRKTISESNSIITSIQAAIDHTAGAIGKVTGFADAFTTVLGDLNPKNSNYKKTSFDPLFATFKYNSNNRTIMPKNEKALRSRYSIAMYDLEYEVASEDAESEDIKYFELEGHIYYLTSNWKEDKPNVLRQYMEYHDIAMNTDMVKRFLIHEIGNNTVAYNSASSIKDAITKLFLILVNS